MSSFSHYLTDLATAPFAQFLLDAAAKATVLLLVAITATMLLRRSSAALRHRLWCLTFAALVLLPGLSAALPEWRLAILPRAADEGVLAGRSLAPQAPKVVGTLRVPQLLADRRGLSPQVDFPRADSARYDAPLRGETLNPPPTAPAETPSARRPPNIAILWLVGAFLAFSPLLVGLARTLLLRRQARPMDDAGWSGLLEELRARLAMARRVDLLETEAALMPMTWGLLRPVVMLPRQARAWTERLRRFVLLHELAHVKRCDVGFQMLGRLACAVYWFHPLAWYALRRLRIERELACDDCVVSAGERASDYALELLQIARSYRPVPFAVAVAMAQRSNLEHRVRALFDRACSHLPVTPRAARLLLVAVLVVATAVAAVRLVPRAAAGEQSAGDATDDSAADRSQGKSANEGRRHLSGRAIDDKGQPVVGARVRVFRTYWSRSGNVATAPAPQWLADTRSETDGRFSAEFEPLSTADESQARMRGFSESVGVFVTAEGFGIGLRFAEPAESEAVGLRLPHDSSPIEGRLLDLEGRPVRGARVTVRAVAFLDHVPHGLEDWLAEVRESGAEKGRVYELPNGAMMIEFDSFLNPFGATTTDGEGRFAIAGVGNDRIAYLQIEGAKMASTWLPVVTRPIKPLPLATGLLRFATQTCYGARCDIVTVPAQPIRGVVRDAEIGAPLKGAEVQFKWNDTVFNKESGLSATTDADGRYELLGLPKPTGPDETVELRIVPATAQPYFRTEVNVPREGGLDSVTCAVSLRRAVALHGQITDRKTGEPVRGAVRYYPFLTNPFAQAFPNFPRRVQTPGYDERYATDDQGRYVIPAAPGRGVLTVVAEQGDHYALADGAEQIADLLLPGSRQPNVYHLSSLAQDNAIRETDVRPDASELAKDVQLTPLPITRLLLVDERGNELPGVETQGLAPMNPFADRWSNTWREPLSTASTELLGPEAGETRETLFLDRANNLGAMVRFTAESIGGERTKRIVLRPCGTVKGRIVDGRGQPVAGAWVNGEVFPRGAESPHDKNSQPASLDQRFAWRLTLNLARADAGGRFEMKGVPPGASYAIEGFAEKRGEKWRALTAAIEPGQTIELGDLVPEAKAAIQEKAAATPQTDPPSNGKKTEPRKVEQPGAAAMSERKSQSVTLRGRVLLPDGKPAAGADLYWPHVKSPPARTAKDIRYTKRAAADEEGRFRIALAESDLPATRVPLNLVAHQAGFGIDWFTLELGEAPADVTLRLVEDRPIRGRVTDTEGRPVAGVRVAVNGVWASREGSLDAFLAVWSLSWHDSWRKLDHRLHAPLDAIMGTASDRDGRFELSGVGVERVAAVEINPPGYAADQLRVVHRQGFDAAQYNDITRAAVSPLERREGLYPRLAGPDLDYVAEAELIVRGKVFTGADRTPVGGAAVHSYGRGDGQMLSVISDEQGRYALHGLARNRKSLLGVSPSPGSVFLPRTVNLAAAPAQSAIDLDVEMMRGVIVEGRVFDQSTGSGLKSGVRFVPLPGNKFADQPGYDHYNRSRVSDSTDNNGRFRLVVIPGPGALMADVDGGPRIGDRTIDRYRQATFSEAERQRVLPTEDGDDRYFTAADNSRESLAVVNAVRMIDLPEAGPTVSCDLPVDPGKTLMLAVEDDQGKPLSDCLVAGLTDTWPVAVRIAEPTFTIYGLGADRPRRVCVLHPDRKLAASIILTGEEQRPVKVQLGAAASIVGRAYDSSGEPIADAVVQVNYARRSASALDRFVGLERSPARTDGDGRFRVENIVPGERLMLDFKQSDVYFRASLTDEQRTLQAGQKLALGDMTVKELR